MATVDMKHPDPASVPVRDAATVVLVRQGSGGLQVCMLQRNLKSDFVGGAYVFPGGAVDPEDSDPAYEKLSFGGQSSGEDLAFRVAVARESFEEAGILIARSSDGTELEFSDPTVKTRFEQHRRDVDSGSRQLHEICVEEELLLDVGGLGYLSRWVTPFGAPRRYDTRFYVVEAPAGQVALHDDREVIDTVWITPADALEDSRSGRRTMIFPTIRTMAALSRFDEVAALTEYVAGLGPITAVEPVMTQRGDHLELELPGDPEGTGGKYDAITGEPVTAS
ncbi:MAG: NUDIX domain-containing protein [Microthrixaceae bacterium]